MFEGDPNRRNKLGLCLSTFWLLYDRLEDISPPVFNVFFFFFTLSIQTLCSFRGYFLLLCAVFIHSESS